MESGAVTGYICAARPTYGFFWGDVIRVQKLRVKKIEKFVVSGPLNYEKHFVRGVKPMLMLTEAFFYRKAAKTNEISKKNCRRIFCGIAANKASSSNATVTQVVLERTLLGGLQTIFETS